MTSATLFSLNLINLSYALLPWVLSFCEKIYLGKNIEGTKILFSEGGNEVIQGTNGQTQGSYSSNAAQYITNDRVGVVAQ